MAHVPDGYRALWIGVLAQAVSDVTNPSQGEFFRQARRDAIRWFKHGGRDFNEVCHLAGLDPEAVRDRFQAGRLQYIKINRHAQRRTG